MADHRWQPASALSGRDRPSELAALPPLYERWRQAETRLRAADPARLQEIKRRLVRRMIVEVGLLESLYELDRPTTEKLVTDGFVLEHVAPSATDMQPARLITMLQDQDAAIAPMLQGPAGPLSKDDIRRFHAVAMQHVATGMVTDAAGVKKEVPLMKGEFKTLPNTLEMPDGSTHEFCPVERVDEQLDAVLEGAERYRQDDPVLASAWLHYHLYQVHPFQHGNGRIVRAATTQLMLRSGLLPIVIEREERAAYKTGMKTGDSLAPLAAVFARAARDTIARALDEAKTKSRKAS